jgi:outer membrane protein assembly factor BamA
VGELYRNQGYLYAQVNPVIDRRPPAEGETIPRWLSAGRSTRQQPAYIRRINIVGNTFTHDRIIREQIALLPGQLYSEADILRSYQAISGLGFFETPLPFPDIQPDPETGDVDITFQVTEQQTGSINFGTAMGGYRGIRVPRLRPAESLRPGQVREPPLGLRPVPEQLPALLHRSVPLPVPGQRVHLPLRRTGPLLLLRHR